LIRIQAAVISHSTISIVQTAVLLGPKFSRWAAEHSLTPQLSLPDLFSLGVDVNQSADFRSNADILNPAE